MHCYPLDRAFAGWPVGPLSLVLLAALAIGRRSAAADGSVLCPSGLKKGHSTFTAAVAICPNPPRGVDVESIDFEGVVRGFRGFPADVRIAGGAASRKCSASGCVE
jgi:hypothetical protein